MKKLLWESVTDHNLLHVTKRCSILIIKHKNAMTKSQCDEQSICHYPLSQVSGHSDEEFITYTAGCVSVYVCVCVCVCVRERERDWI
jgi:hypothetical protein